MLSGAVLLLRFWHFYEVIQLPVTLLSGALCLEASTGIDLFGRGYRLQFVPILTSLAAFMSWIKCLYFMRAYSATGGLVRLMIEITFEMR